MHRLFDGVDERLRQLRDPSATSEQLRAGLVRLRQCMEQYKITRRLIEEEEEQFAALYPIYVQVQEALGLPVKAAMEFEDVKDLEAALEQQKPLVERAQECAKIYRFLGKDAYVCLAFDTEMRAMGYKVVERERIMERVTDALQGHRTADGKVLPAYDMPGGEAITQIYEIDENCWVQVIFHPDGTTTMQTVMEGEEEEKTVETQKKHCGKMAELARRVRENWFVSCDIGETEKPEVIHGSMAGFTDRRRGDRRRDNRRREGREAGEQKKAAAERK